MELCLKHVLNNLLSLEVAEASNRVGEKNPNTKTSPQNPKGVFLPSALYPLMDEMEWYGFMP